MMTDNEDGPKIKLAIVEDEGLFRDLLTTVLSQHPRLNVVDTFPDGESMLEAALDLQPDVAILDIVLPGALNGVQVGLRRRRQLPILK